MLAEKTTLTLEEIESQDALELQDRELMSLVTVVVANNDIAASVCANVITNQSLCLSNARA